MDKYREDVSKDLASFVGILPEHSENETNCSGCSYVEEFFKDYEQEMDNQLEKFACNISQESEKIKKKRGRKPLRPHDPIRKKTEIKDKYWLRAFRNFIKIHFNIFRKQFSQQQLEFWLFYTGKLGKPGKESKFLSYGKRYKDYLFSEPSFSDVFKAWFVEFGESELLKKYKPGSDLWFIYYDYALKEIACFGKRFELYRDSIKGIANIHEISENIDNLLNN